MNFSLTEEQEAIQKGAREFLVKESVGLAREAEENIEGYSRRLWQKMAELGWMGVCIPDEYGGNGGNFFDLILILEEMGKTLVPGPFIPAVICSGHAILKYGNEAQKREFLPKLTIGKLLIIPALCESVSPRTQYAMRNQVDFEREDYVLSGTRLFVPYAHVADWFIWGAETPEGKSLFLIDAESPGKNCTFLKTMALDKQCEVALERVRVPKANILGKVGKGEQIRSEIDEWGALSECGFILGLLEQVLKMSVEYAKKRKQFGKTIGSFQIIQHQCADMATDIDQVKLLTYQAAWKLSQGLPATKEISMAKARASDASRKVSLSGTKIHGGIGIMIDHDMQLFFRRAKAAELSFGDGDIHREIVARELGI